MRILYLFTILALFACNNSQVPSKTTKVQTNKEQNVKNKLPKVKLNQISTEVLTIGATIPFTFSSKAKDAPDSILWITEDSKIKLALTSVNTFNIKADNLVTGTQKLRFKFYWGDSVVVNKYYNITLWSDIKPEKLGYKVLKTFTHNVKSYTQGLEFADGYLYEGTGQTGESTLSKIDLDKNELLNQINLPKDVFGEGITILNDKIYQITWQSQVGFVYDKKSLRKLYEFSYPTEGWGLCNNGNSLIMSDGSENIYFLDTEFMQETHRLQVYDHNGPVSRLNELEYVDGLIYANIYGTDEIVAFEEKTGRVLKRINLKGILDKQKVKTPIDVLNGIAWDAANKRMIVTGKWWPKLFHVEFIPIK